MSSSIHQTEPVLETSAAALTDQGRVREINEDAVFYRSGQTQTGDEVGLYMVCDGLGGHQAGEIASQLAVKTVSQSLDGIFEPSDGLIDLSPAGLRQSLELAVKKANARVLQYAYDYPREAFGLGTTITLALLYQGVAYLANVGDSRAYLWREGRITQLTQDHSLSAEMFRLGLISEEELPGHLHKNVLSRAVGMEPEITVDLFEWELQTSDRLLLCTDGLWQAFSDLNDLAWHFNLIDSPSALCRRLIQEANRRDGSDNLSAVVINVDQVSDWTRPVLNSRPISKLYTAVLVI